MKFILYGPPGVGKSTTIAMLGAAGYKAFDLEDFPSNREEILELADNAFIGGADTKPTSRPDRVNILLYLDEDVYARRREERDASQPEKSEQPVQRIQDWIDLIHWNHVLQADSLEPATFDDILEHPGLYVPPKPTKNSENWTEVVKGHADAVHAMLSWAGTRLTRAG